MKQYKRLKESVDEKDMVKFISDNVKFLDKYDARELYYKTMAHKFNDEFDTYLSTDRYGKFRNDSLNFETDAETYDELAKAFNNFRVSTGISPEDEKLKKAFTNLTKSYFSYQGNGVLSYYSHVTLGYLFFILYYVCKNIIGKDLGDANKLEAKYKEIIQTPGAFQIWLKDFAPVKFKVSEFGVDIAIMKNGKLVIKGLSSQEEQKMEHLFKVVTGR